MQNIILLFAKYGSFITFIVLQVLCFNLIVNYNHTQRETFLNSANHYASLIDAKTSQWRQYLYLQNVNDSLNKHNGLLLEKFINLKNPVEYVEDSTLQYTLIPANIVRNTFNLRNNSITLNIGKGDNVEKDMGVIGQSGILGIVKDVSQNFSHVISILNSQTRISATVRPHAYPGVLSWKDLDPMFMNLDAIPKHIPLNVGDTVVTNGYSTIFPPNITIGTISEYHIDKGSNYYTIRVKLVNDVPGAKTAYVIENKLAAEQLLLEKDGDE